MLIIRNAIRCTKCFDVIESKYRHDFVTCKCGAVSVDGGLEYLKRTGTDWEELAEIHQFGVGDLLCTKDGRKIGNAIVIAVGQDNTRTVTIRTDFGNRLTMTEQMIPVYFFVESGLKNTPVELWEAERKNTDNKVV